MLVLRMSSRRRLRVGKLGRFRFPAGYYLYPGSALGGLAGCVQRHLRVDKPRHSHIDFLAPPALAVGVWWATSAERRECEFAQRRDLIPGRIDARGRVRSFRLPLHLAPITCADGPRYWGSVKAARTRRETIRVG